MFKNKLGTVKTVYTKKMFIREFKWLEQLEIAISRKDYKIVENMLYKILYLN